MLESIGELSQERAEQFLQTFYFDYGHRSIADLAHLVFALEQVSILAAIEIVDEQLWDGQERSTRYQPFRKTGWYVPDAIRETAVVRHLPADRAGALRRLPGPGRRAAGAAGRERAAPGRASPRTRFGAPCAHARSTSRAACCRWPRTPASVRSSARARWSGRSAVCSRSRYAEVRAIGAELRAACERPAEAPLLDRIVQSVHGDGSERPTICCTRRLPDAGPLCGAGGLPLDGRRGARRGGAHLPGQRSARPTARVPSSWPSRAAARRARRDAALCATIAAGHSLPPGAARRRRV